MAQVNFTLTQEEVLQVLAGNRDEAFKYCEKLKNIEISSCVKFIGEDAFFGCNENLVISGYNPSIACEYATKEQIKFNTIFNAVKSGMCGKNLTWVFYENGTLVVTGNGNMESYDIDIQRPWSSLNIENIADNVLYF